MNTLVLKDKSKRSYSERTSFIPRMMAKPVQSVNPAHDMPIIQTKCACGGGCPACIGSHMLQAKLTIGQPDDKHEREADRIADQVVHAPDPLIQRRVYQEEDEGPLQTKPIADQITPLIQRQVESEDEEEEQVQSKLSGNKAPAFLSSTGLQKRINSFKRGGHALPSSERGFFESRFGCDFSHVRVHTGPYAVHAAKALNAKAFTIGKDVYFNSSQYTSSSQEGKKLLAHELTHVVQQSNKLSTLQRKVDFEFDLNYGTENTYPATSSKANGARKWSKTPITKHRRKDTSGNMKDGFKVVQDGNRIEITTLRFGLGSEGRSKLTKTMDNIMAFVDQLETDCSSAPRKSISRPTDTIVTRSSRPLGRSRSFKLPGVSESPNRVFVPLGGSGSPYFRRGCKVSAAPQATIDVSLGKIEDIVAEIRETKGKPPGEALTGGRKYRAGSRSDALFQARDSVNSDWIRHKGHTTLTDGTPVTSMNFSPRLKGFMILMVSYLRTSMLSYGKGDYEPFAKAYPPIVTHTRFRDMYHRILNDDERKVFEELYGGTASAKDKLYKLAGKTSGGATERLFPAKVQAKQERTFGRPLFWDDLVKMTISDTPLIDSDGDESLFTPLAGATKGPTRAGPKKIKKIRLPIIGELSVERREKVGTRLEMRRIGFNWVAASKWRGLTDMVFDLACRLNR